LATWISTHLCITTFQCSRRSIPANGSIIPYTLNFLDKSISNVPNIWIKVNFPGIGDVTKISFDAVVDV